MHHETESIIIDEQLRWVLFGLQCKLGIHFSVPECERIFSDSETDQVNAKEYLLYSDNRLLVSGKVDEYEPESVWLEVQCKKPVGLNDIVEMAKYELIRKEKAFRQDKAR